MARAQQRLVRLKKIIDIESFVIVGLWSNGETRLNDFNSKVNKWQKGNNPYLIKLADTSIFKTAFISDGTLAFSDVLVEIEGFDVPQPLDLDPDVIFKESILVGNTVSLNLIKSEKRIRKTNINFIKGSSFDVKSSKKRISKKTFSSHNTIYKLEKAGVPFKVYAMIGDEIIEIENTWTSSDLLPQVASTTAKAR